MQDKDWEFSEEFFQTDEEKDKELPLFEDFVLKDRKAGEEEAISLIGNEKLRQTVADIRIVRKLIEDQMTIADIAEKLDMEQDYVLLITMNIQGGSDKDDDIAIAHLVLMG